MEMEDVATIDEISERQWAVVILLQIFLAALSVIGSTAIVFKILRDRAQNGSTTPYDRMILGLSLCEIPSSIMHGIDDFLWPTGSYFWAFGNQATCVARGFLSQFAIFWAIWYNGLLSYYFLLTVVSQVQRKNYVQKFELWLHLSGLFFPITAFIGLCRGWFSDDDPCFLTDKMLRWILTGVPTSFVFLSMIINYSAIYAIVRKSLKSPEHGTGSQQKQLKKEARTVMFLYVAAFFLTITPTYASEIMIAYFDYSYYDSRIYALFVFKSCFVSLQGFFNFFIYLRPAYTRFREANPTRSMCFVLHQALFNPKPPRRCRYPRVANAMTEEYIEGLESDGGSNPNLELFAVHNRRHAVVGVNTAIFTNNLVEEEDFMNLSLELFDPLSHLNCEEVVAFTNNLVGEEDSINANPKLFDSSSKLGYEEVEAEKSVGDTETQANAIFTNNLVGEEDSNNPSPESFDPSNAEEVEAEKSVGDTETQANAIFTNNLVGEEDSNNPSPESFDPSNAEEVEAEKSVGGTETQANAIFTNNLVGEKDSNNSSLEIFDSLSHLKYEEKVEAEKSVGGTETQAKED